MKVIATGVACSLLNEQYAPTSTIAVGSILTEPPYRRASVSRVKCQEYSKSDPDLIVDRINLAYEISREHEADAIHLDIPIRGIDVLSLNPGVIDILPFPHRAKTMLKEALPKIQETAKKMKQERNLMVRAVGKRSLSAKIAKLTVASGAVDYAAKRCLSAKKTVRIGLPISTTVRIEDENIIVKLKDAEKEYEGIFESSKDVLKEVSFEEYVNPMSQMFGVLEIKPLD